MGLHAFLCAAVAVIPLASNFTQSSVNKLFDSGDVRLGGFENASPGVAVDFEQKGLCEFAEASCFLMRGGLVKFDYEILFAEVELNRI